MADTNDNGCRNKEGFRKELEQLLNKNCMENGSNTPDFLLANYMLACLNAADMLISERDRWHTKEICKMHDKGID